MASVTVMAASSANNTPQLPALFPSTPHTPSSTEHFQSSLSPSPAARETTASQSFTQDWSGSLLFDVIKNTSPSSADGGGESGVSVSSASLYPSSSVFETAPDLFSSSGEGQGASSVLTGEGSWGGSDVVTTTMLDTVSVQQTTVMPTPASSVVSPMSSVFPTLGDTSGSGFGESTKDVLIVAVPVGVTVLILIVILIILCIRCCCRKEKKGVRVEKEDLWKEGGGLQVAVVPMTVLPASQSTEPSSTVTASAADGDAVAVNPPQDSRLLYTAVYEFPGQLDSQLTLTPGDVIQVEARADHGWLRGVIRGDNRSGWFPSSFVVPLSEEGDTGHPTAATTAETAATAAAAESGRTEEGGRPCVSSFLLRKKPSKRPPQLDTVPRLTDLHSQVSLNKQCGTVGTAVTPVSPVRLRDSNPLHTEQFSASVKDKYYKALFAYKAAYRGELTLRKGEMVVGKERDRNGWMLGRSLQSEKEGWFPSVYVDQVTADVTSSSRTERDDRNDMTSSNVSRDVYTVLDVNRNKSQDQAWVAIEHRVTKQYDPHADNHIALHVGDVVAVVQALECGWCLGCHGDQLGWFPADHVELLEEKSEGKMDSFSLLPLCRASLPFPQTPHSNDVSQDLPPPSSPLDLSQESILSEGERPRPARRAPRPPLQASQHLQGSVGNLSTASTQSANPRPARPAPAPPSSTSTRCDSVSSVGSMDRLEGPGGRPGGRSMSMSVHVAARRQRKARVVRIAKERLRLDKLSSFPSPVPRSPSVASCPSPPIMPPSGAHNPFSLRTADTPRHSPPSSAAAAEGHLDSEVMDTKDDLQQSGSVPDHTVQDEVKGKENLFGETPPEGDKGVDGNEDDGAHNADTKTCEGPSGGLNPGKEAASPSATSIAVQTDIPDPTKDDSHDFRPPESDRLTTGTPSPATDLHPSEDPGCRQDDAEEAARGGNSTSSSEDVTYDPDSSSSVHNGHTDSGSEEDIHSAGLPPQGQSPPPADSANTPAPAKTDPASPPTATHTSPADRRVSRSTPKATPPLPDLLLGTKIPPQPVHPKPTSPCSVDSRSRAPGGSKDLRPKEEEEGDKSSASVRLAPVVCPVSQKEGEEEEGLAMPPEGVSGRVSMIVSQINRMASMEEDHHPNLPDRKPSLPLSSWPADMEELAPDALKDAHPPPCSEPQQTRGSLHQEGGETGWSARGTRDNASHQNGVEQVSPASQQADQELQAGTPPAENPQETAADASWENRRSSRPQSGKGARVAPPPPTSPPPPHTRKSQRLKSGRKKAIES